MNSAWMEAMALLFSRDGYMVMGSERACEVGEMVPDRFGTGVWYRVTGPASLEDARRQMGILCKHYGEDFVEPVVPAHFYKTVMVAH